MKQPVPPFTCTYSPNIPELLWDLECTIAITTYQAGKLIFISSASPNDLVQLPRTFNKPMGIAVEGNKIAVATKNEVVVFADSPAHAPGYPESPNTYDHLYIPRSTYYCGDTDTHDLIWGKPGLMAVNTRFCCLSVIDDDYSFKPLWKPSFISELIPEDRCHLNGLTLQDGLPKYVSALGDTNTAQGWREKKKDGGILIDVPTGEIVCRGLAMPHSPRIYNDKLYTLLSATGQLICVDTKTGKYDVVNEFDGFVRGLARCGDYLFVGLSKLREKSSAFADLPIAKKSLNAGIVVVYLPMGSIVGQIKYESSVEEIYDVQIIPNTRRPGMMSLAKETHRRAIVTPDSTFWAITEEEANNSSK
jgi:uncharacterized protein (TIGR03032 family)